MLPLLLTTLVTLTAYPSIAHSSSDVYSDQPNSRVEQYLRLLEDAARYIDSKTRRAQSNAILATLLDIERNANAQIENDSPPALDLEATPVEERPIKISTRTCRLRLGGHCRTQELHEAMKQYEYLMSPESPGRKRRSLRSMLFNRH